MDDFPRYTDYRSGQPTNDSTRPNPTKPLLTPRARPSSNTTGHPAPNEGVGALVCGILGLFFCGVVLGPIAIYLGSQSESGLAKAGKALGIVAVIGWAVYVVVVLAGNA
ncbi:DUF4190 domain-containing protein [Microlunatus speluncae]|uniref:DUF4190 domain-containing protein n=1 Tax=Microlunatus speluncae TaxID=2594267 RepID=UPI001582D6AE|nr:DUF4190 domain-containing protein [Microlunatus speluncae]